MSRQRFATKGNRLPADSPTMRTAGNKGSGILRGRLSSEDLTSILESHGDELVNRVVYGLRDQYPSDFSTEVEQHWHGTIDRFSEAVRKCLVGSGSRVDDHSEQTAAAEYAKNEVATLRGRHSTLVQFLEATRLWRRVGIELLRDHLWKAEGTELPAGLDSVLNRLELAVCNEWLGPGGEPPELKRADCSLNSVKGCLEGIFGSFPGPVICYSHSLRVVFHNPAASSILLGPDRKDCSTSALEAATTWLQPSLQEFLSSGSPSTEFDRIVDGRVYDVTLSRFADRRNRAGAVATFADVTERRSISEKMTLLEQAVDSALDMIVITDCHGMIQYVNRSFVRRTGYAEAEVVGEPMSMLQPNPGHDSVYSRLLETVMGGETWQGKLTERRKSGALYPVETRITPVLGSDHKVTHLVAIMRDLTTHHAVEMEERRTRLIFEQALETVPIPLFVKDQFGVYVYWNSHLASLAGKEKSQIVGSSAFDVMPSEVAVRHREMDDLLLKDGGVLVYEGEIQGPNGDLKPFRIHKACVRGESNEVIGIIGALVDITESRRLESVQAEAQASRWALAALENVMSFLSHELNSPIASIHTSAELLLDSRTDSELSGQLSSLIHSEVGRMANVVADTLDLARMTLGTAQWHWHEFDLTSLLDRVAETWADPAHSYRSVSFSCSCARGIRIEGDSNAIERLIEALVANAVKYSEGGAVHLSAESREVERVAYARIVISDNGPGIHPSILARLDQPFSLSVGLVGEHQANGPGLGLAISKGIVEAHLGFWEIESALGQGTSIRIYLPTRRDSLANRRRRPS